MWTIAKEDSLGIVRVVQPEGLTFGIGRRCCLIIENYTSEVNLKRISLKFS